MASIPLASRPHDHASCIDRALQAAEQICAHQNLRLTVLRRRVLELVWQSHEPLGAYDILAVLSEEDGRRAAPPTVYRALDFLLEHGLVHRIASLNAFIGCPHPEQVHQGQFLICRNCRSVTELKQRQVSQVIDDAAGTVGFQADSQTVEVLGMCVVCRGVS